jgi:hypothetical protein
MREGPGLVLDVLSLGRAADVAAALAEEAAGVDAGAELEPGAEVEAGADGEPGAESPLDVEADPEPGIETDPMAALVRDVSAAIGAHLVWAGLARWDFGWSRPLMLRSTGDDEPVVPEPVVADACGDPAAVVRLRAYLRELRVNEATTAPWAIPGRRRLDPGELTRSRHEAQQPPRLLLPDELLMLIRHSRSRNPPTSDTMRAAVVASVLAELRLRGRLTVARDRTGLVGVRSQEPTGEPFLDGVLVRIAAGGQQPAYRWLQMLGPDAYAAVEERQRQLKGRWVYRDHGRLMYERTEATLAQGVGRELLDAVRAGESDTPGPRSLACCCGPPRRPARCSAGPRWRNGSGSGGRPPGIR